MAIEITTLALAKKYVESTLQNAGALKGDPGLDGKSAYQYAQDGGYTGTEEEFAQKLAKEIKVDSELSEESENPVQNKVVAQKFSQLSDTVNDLDGLTHGIYVGDTQPTNSVMYWLDTSDDSTGGEDTEVTLSSISATYSGGSVLVGTSVNDLTGITVKAHYSDGTTATVTGYTLSGTIAEGSNTITISYGGETTTITVIGYKEEEEPITLNSISATYTGGNVPVGTALTDLTGITVTGTYSDGSTSAITGYTLSGEITEGENTITVTYEGLTATFTVTGITESGGSNDNLAEENIIATETNNGDIMLNVDAVTSQEKIYYYRLNVNEYSKLNIKARFTPSWGATALVNALTNADAVAGTNPIIPKAYNHISNGGYIVYEIDVTTLMTQVQALYNDGTLDSTKEKQLFINEGNGYLLYNYVD